ncbi:MAG: hypothetical protein KatS3mg008_1728 [Acidimicrobiales bacterium]|nr:MAG: hypothetical protein KatS3mg008_1728 [Acidimicrobiales bacterium]
MDLDIQWFFVDGPLGPGRWLQAFRDGLETPEPTRPSRCYLEIRVTYGQMVRVLYADAGFESMLTPDQIRHLVTPLSCLEGLLHGPCSPRRGLFSGSLLEAILAWADMAR